MDATMIFKFSTKTEEGEKDGKKWKRCTALFETVEHFPKQVAVTCMGDMVDKIKGYRPGHLLKVKVDADSHEYNGKYYTELRAWSIKPAYEIPKEEPEHKEPEKPDFDNPLPPL